VTVKPDEARSSIAAALSAHELKKNPRPRSRQSNRILKTVVLWMAILIIAVSLYSFLKN
jgi:hypothetical protein